MATIRTEITEIVTGLAMLGYRRLDHALGVRPRLMTHVTEQHFDRLIEARAADDYRAEFETAWANGQRFAFAPEGLRGRPPWFLEWKGSHKPPAYEQVPADLRVDHVYLISCKYGSNILMNAGPSYLFDRVLAGRRRPDSDDWYQTVAPESVRALWSACRRALGDEVARDLPDDPAKLTSEHRRVFKPLVRGRRWPSTEAEEAYRWMAADVSNQSAGRWTSRLSTKSSREEMVWRLLRFAPAPYFVLGAATDGSHLHYRVDTPWDFRQRYRLTAFDAWGDAVGQPVVRWRIEVKDHESGDTMAVDGHVEVRWSHGRFGGNPEAKIYLDTPHHRVPGYRPLTDYTQSI